MSAQPEVAITIMTGGRTADAGTSATGEAGPVPAALDQLAATATGTQAADQGAPTPQDLDQLAATATGTQTADQGAPTPQDLDQLAATAKPAKKAAAKKSSGTRGG